jgi:hypothetical protein
MIDRRRSLIAIASVATVSLFPTIRASSQVAGLAKIPWGNILAGVQVVLTAIPYLRDWFQGNSPEAKAIFCKLATDDLSNLEFRCIAVALALDSNGEGAVVPPEEGIIGIIPALGSFVTKRDHESVLMMRRAGLRMLDVSESLISEVAKDNWLLALRSARLKPEDVATLSENIRYAAPIIRDFLLFYKHAFQISKSDIDAANGLSIQLSEMPMSARKAIEAVQDMENMREHTSCNSQ